MTRKRNKFFSLAMSLVLVLSMLCFNTTAIAASSSLTTASGWLETLYAQWDNDNDAKNATVEYKKSSASSYTKADKELVRAYGSTGRVDIPGLSAGNYDIKITTSSGEVLTAANISVKSHDRSGYAHFNYTEGVGAYKDDGTPKDNAIIIYVTEENKDTVTVPGFEDCGQGIGWILNNNRSGMQKITKDNSLIVRFIGKVTNPEGTTAYNSTDNGGSVKDNGHMARIRGGKNITLEGIGYDAMIYDWGVHFIAADDTDGKNFEVRNLTFDDYPEDAVGMEGVQTGSTLTAPVRRCWVHNNSFLSGYCANPAESDKAEGDGSSDFKRGEYFTLSYNYYEDCHKTNLVGASDSNLQFNLTFHHNWWKNCASRGPLLRQANIHIYNNYYQGNTSKTIDTRANSYAFVEANYLENCKNPITTTSGSAVKSFDNIFYSCLDQNSGVVVSKRDEIVSNSCQKGNFDTDSSKFYYDSANKVSDVEHLTSAAVAKSECIAYSGVMKQTPVEPEEPTIIKVKPSRGVNLPYSINFVSGDAAEKMTAAGISDLSATNTELDNIIYNMGKKFNNTAKTQAVVKSQSITFKLDQEAVVTLDGASGSYYPVLINSTGLVLLEQAGSVTVPAGCYIIQSSVEAKEAKLNGFSIAPVGEVITTSEVLTESTTKNTETTTNKTTETTTNNSETPIETTTQEAEDDGPATGVVAMGSYDLSSATLKSKVCTYKNMEFNLRSVESSSVKLRIDNTIKFKVDRNCKLTVNPSGKGIFIIDEQGNSELKSTGTVTVELKPGTYSITGAASGGNTTISKLIFEATDADETVTEKPSETTTEEQSENESQESTESGGSSSNDTVKMGTYILNSSNLSSTDCSYENMDFDVRSVDDNGICLRNGDSIIFKVGINCILTADPSEHGIIITDEKGNSQTKPSGTVKIELKPGTYTINGENSSNNTILTKLIFESSNNDSEDTTESTSEGSSESTSESTSEDSSGSSSDIFGDVNGDKKVNSRDAVLIIKYVLNLSLIPSEYVFKLADVDGDNYITATDATLVMKKSINSDFIFPVSKK